MKIIEKLKNKNYSLDTIGKSGANVLVFDDSVLKIQKNNEEAQNELKTLLWLEKQEEIVSPRIFEAEIRDENLFILRYGSIQRVKSLVNAIGRDAMITGPWLLDTADWDQATRQKTGDGSRS